MLKYSYTMLVKKTTGILIYLYALDQPAIIIVISYYSELM